MVFYSVNQILGNNAALALLTEVDQALDLVQLADDNETVSHLQKHCETIKIAAPQQLYQLGIVLQLFKMIAAC